MIMKPVRAPTDASVAASSKPEPLQVDVLVAGSLASDTICDYIPAHTAAANIGPILETSNPSTIAQSAGGVGRNVAVAAHYAGANVALASVVANDVAGMSLLDQLQMSGLFTGLIRQLDVTDGARTAQYVAVNDAKKDLVLAMADMSILTRPELEAEHYWHECLRSANPKWIVVDSNWSPAIMSSIISAAKAQSIPVAFEPVSTAKAIRLFDKTYPSIKASNVVPNHSIRLATPNTFELTAIHTALRENDYLASQHWWQVIDALGLSSTDTRDKFVSITSTDLVQQGVPQQCIQLLPYIPSLVTKLGSRGSLLTQLLRPNDSRLRHPDHAPYILARNLEDDAVLGGVYMRLFPPAAHVDENEIIGVNGIGDTMLGTVMAGLVKGRELHEIIPIAQEAAVLSLKSKEAVSPKVQSLRTKLR